MRKPEQDSFEGRHARGNKYVSLASMSVLVVIIGMLLTFALPRVLPEGTKPDGTLLPAPLLEPDIPTPTPTPAPRVYQLALGTGGSLGQDVHSEDDLALLSLARGTKVVDAQGQPLSSVTVTARRLTQRVDIAYVGLAYEFGPEGATLDPPASLTITYDPRAYYPFQLQGLTYPSFWQTIDARRVYLTYLAEEGPLPPLAVVDSSTASVTAKIDHLGTIILYCALL